MNYLWQMNSRKISVLYSSILTDTGRGGTFKTILFDNFIVEYSSQYQAIIFFFSFILSIFTQNPRMTNFREQRRNLLVYPPRCQNVPEIIILHLKICILNFFSKNIFIAIPGHVSQRPLCYSCQTKDYILGKLNWQPNDDPHEFPIHERRLRQKFLHRWDISIC